MTRHMSEETRKEQILEAARASFVETGFIPTRMEDIAARAGLSKGGVYFHFSSKRQLLLELVEQEYLRSMAFLHFVREGEGTFAEKLEALARFFPVYFAEHPESTRLFVVISEAAMRDEVVRERLRDMQDAYLDGVSRLLEEAIARGEIRPMRVRPVSIMLKAIMDGFEGAAALGLFSEVEEVLSSGLQIVLRGMGYQGPEPDPAETDAIG